MSSFGNFFFTSFDMSKLIGNSRANRAQYTDVSFRNLGVGIGVDGVRVVELPGMEGTTEEGQDEGLPDLSLLDLNKPQSEDVFSSPKQLEGDLITLTLLPRERWMSLLHLDTIQVGARIIGYI